MALFGNPLQRNPLQKTARIERILERERLDDPLHFAAPTRRELRTQAVHRLQIGLLGLAAILLLIALASAIMQHARQTQDSAVVDPVGAARTAAARPSGTPGDPLADMGVAPEMRATRVPGPAPSSRSVPQDPARPARTP